MKTFKGTLSMKYILYCFVVTFAFLTLTACGGGGGDSTQPAASTYTLSFSSGANGSLSGTASQTVNQGASSSIVSAVAVTGYHFVNWTEGATVVGVNAALSVHNVTANHSYTANFAADAAIKTSAILKINLTGTLPAGTAISGAAFTLTLPANVTPALVSGVVANGVITPSGTFVGGTQAPPLYTVATASAPGTIYLTLVNPVAAGTTQVGEVATITLQLTNGVTPVAGSFGVSGVSVSDVLYNSIGSMSATVASVTLQ